MLPIAIQIVVALLDEPKCSVAIEPGLFTNMTQQTVKVTTTGTCSIPVEPLRLRGDFDDEIRLIDVSLTNDTLTTTQLIDKDWVSAAGKWSLLAGDKTVAEVSLGIVSFEPNPSLEVVFPRDPQMRMLDSWEVDHAASNPLWGDATKYKASVANLVTFSFPNKLPSSLNWKAEPNQSSVEILDSDYKPSPGATNVLHGTQLRFVAAEPSKHPVVLKMTGTDGANAFSFEVQVAKRVAKPRLELSLFDAATVMCPYVADTNDNLTASRGEFITVTNTVISNDTCYLTITPDKVFKAIADRHGIPYRIEPKDKKEAEKEAKKSAPEQSELTLANANENEDYCTRRAEKSPFKALNCFIPSNDAAVDDLERLLSLYDEIEVHVAMVDDVSKQRSLAVVRHSVAAMEMTKAQLDFPGGDSSPATYYVVYVGATKKSVDGTISSAGVNTIVARIRPRGTFGLRPFRRSKSKSFGARVYLTVPVSVVGLQFPAPSQDLTSSKQSPNVRASTFNTGILFVAEPWNYATGKHRYSGFPFYAATGMLFASVGENLVIDRPQWITGMGVSLPLLTGKNQLDSSVSLGVYYDVDLRNVHPFASGSHLLILLGFNVFSVFGAESTAKK